MWKEVIHQKTVQIRFYLKWITTLQQQSGAKTRKKGIARAICAASACDAATFRDREFSRKDSALGKKSRY